MGMRARTLVVLTLGTLLLAPLAGHGQDEPPVVVLDLPTDGPQGSLGAWLRGALANDGLQVLWPQAGEGALPTQAPDAVVTWSLPESPGDRTRELRKLVRTGGGLVYVVGAGPRHIRRARSFWGPLDVNLEENDGQSGTAVWVDHPLVAGAGAIGPVTPGAFISGVGGSPLARVGGGTIALSLDWGPLGRAVVLDESLLFDPLHQDSPRPALREVLVRAVRWAAAGGRAAEAPITPSPPKPETGAALWGSLPEPGPVGPPPTMVALVDAPGDRDGWPTLRPLLLEALAEAGLSAVTPSVDEDEPVITEEQLSDTGVLVVGSGREDVAVSEALAVEHFFEAGGRLLFVGHARTRSQKRMIGFNRLLNALPIAATLNRPDGFIELAPHVITAGLSVPEQTRVRGGMQIWSPFADTLVAVGNYRAAVAWQSGQGRVVVLDGELLLAPPGEDRPLPAMIDLLRNALAWLLGDR